MAAVPALPDGLPRDSMVWDQLPEAVQTLLVMLWDLTKVHAQRLAALEARLKQHAGNSDRPPSADSPYTKPHAAATPTGKPGARRGHPGHRQALLEPTEVIEVLPPGGPCGQTDWLDPTPYYTHQVIELPAIQMEVRHFVLHAARCPQCGTLGTAHVPPEVPDGYGPRMTALLGELSGSQRNSRGLVQAFCPSVLGLPSSRGARQRAVERVSEAILPHYEAIGKAAHRAPVNHGDETTWSRNGVWAWWWVMVNTTVAFFSVPASRSKEAFATLVGRWAGILVSDGYGVYRQWVYGRQSCLAHLIRRARGLAERQDPHLMRFGQRMLAELQRMVHWAKAPPTRGEVQAWYARVAYLLRCHRERRDAAGKFARTLEREMEPLWMFLVEEGVEPTNNRAERARRFAVLWRKMMQGTSSEQGDRWVERLLSLRETCRLRGMPTFPVLVDAVTCSFNGQAPDLSWI